MSTPEKAVQQAVTRFLAALGYVVSDLSQPRASMQTAGLRRNRRHMESEVSRMRTFTKRAAPVFAAPGTALTDHPEATRAMATSKVDTGARVVELDARQARGRYTNDEMLAELRRVAASVEGPLSRPKYLTSDARISAAAISNRFGGWLAAIEAAGLTPAYAFGGIWENCPICGESFRTDRGAKARKTCSPACARAAMRLNKPNAKGLRSSPQAARGRARARVEVKACEACGHDGSERRLEVHHKDRNPYNNAAGNLQVLCSTCHGAEHRGKRK